LADAVGDVSKSQKATEDPPFEPTNGNSHGNGKLNGHAVAAVDAPIRIEGIPPRNPNPVHRPQATPSSIILKRLGMIILGTHEGTSDVTGFCERNGRSFTLSRIGHLKIEELIVHLGPEIESEIQDPDAGEPDPTKIPFSRVKRAIAAEGSRHRLTGRGYHGVGIWEIGGRMLLVNAGEATIVNGDVSRTTIPIIDDKIFDFGESKKWFDHQWFIQEYPKTADRNYSVSVLSEAVEIFQRWDNWSHASNPEIVAAAVCWCSIAGSTDLKCALLGARIPARPRC
jgi:hypothetical protein